MKTRLRNMLLNQVLASSEVAGKPHVHGLIRQLIYLLEPTYEDGADNRLNSHLNTVDVSNESASNVFHEWYGPNRYGEGEWRGVHESWSKYLRRLRTYLAENGGAPEFLTVENIQVISQSLGIAIPAIAGYSFEVVRGDALMDAYVNGPYSCMSGAEKKKYLHLYRVNPERVGLVKIKDSGAYVGRALVWLDDAGDTLLDRIYPTNGGPHVAATLDYAKAQGWVPYHYRYASIPEGHKHRTVTLLIPKNRGRVRKWPYMDTFLYTETDVDHPDETRFTMHSRDDKPWVYKFNSTAGDKEQSAGAYRCHIADRVVSRGRALPTTLWIGDSGADARRVVMADTEENRALTVNVVGRRYLIQDMVVAVREDGTEVEIPKCASIVDYRGVRRLFAECRVVFPYSGDRYALLGETEVADGYQNNQHHTYATALRSEVLTLPSGRKLHISHPEVVDIGEGNHHEWVHISHPKALWAAPAPQRRTIVTAPWDEETTASATPQRVYYRDTYWVEEVWQHAFATPE